ncbi:MAG: hypothetical protein H6660_11185 [Ardenticatenaceae bacterium]|nr:hypothetical protein [Ardenticatenaceae bacterium]
MFDEEEFAVISKIHTECIETVKQYRRENNATLAETPLDRLYQPVKDAYARLIGDMDFNADEFEVDEIMRRHRLSRWDKPTNED